ncbi:MAG: hypothetical protein RLW62_03925 [Gammaproteobacteria bacterium]
MFDWISAWIALFAGATLFAIALDGENRRRNAMPALAMLGVLAAALYVFLFRA